MVIAKSWITRAVISFVALYELAHGIQTAVFSPKGFAGHISPEPSQINYLLIVINEPCVM